MVLFRRFSFVRLAEHIPKRREGLLNADVMNELMRTKTMKFKERMIYLAKREKRFLFILGGFIGATNLFLQTKVAVIMTHSIAELWVKGKTFLVPEVKYDPCSLQTRGKTNLDTEIENKLADLFIKIDLAAPEGVTGQLLRDICREMGKSIEFPDEISINEFLKILEKNKVDDKFVGVFEEKVKYYVEKVNAWQEKIKNDIDGIKKQVGEFNEEIKTKDDADYLELHMKVLGIRKQELQKKLKKTPNDSRLKLKLSDLEAEIASTKEKQTHKAKK
ncbi:unnamed protein product [Blepharisma stoltei]|uniref:Uncharacterized protein n=1 Tax=Blepharisma stoltei TaxID=1481888 RepID=A0AAU9J593_9CILI|nr:unnamed protein product [Blepharisma stoltei]